ncbi:hypothetical protein ACSBR1_000989 [Camellia fascicularis]
MDNLMHLQIFAISNNMLTGDIPKFLGNCSELRRVRLDHNQLTRNISEIFGVLPNLVYIDLSYNNFYGELSKKLEQCHNLTSIKFSNNKISGNIPLELGGASQLKLLDLSSNHLDREIPKSLGKLALLFNISLSDNKLSGNIPVEFGRLSNLEDLNLAANNLSGSIAIQLGELVKLWNLNLSKNLLGEDILFEIGTLQFLQSLDLGNNLFKGEIPQQIRELQSLETLNLSHNKLSGSIPSSFNRRSSLTSVDISYNHLEGPFPNTKTFQDAPFEAYFFEKEWETKKMRPKEKILKICLQYGAMMEKWCTKTSLKQQKTLMPDIASVWEDMTLFIKPSCQVVRFAVKKLHSSQVGEFDNLRSFTSEIRALAEIRHRNVIKLYGFCSYRRHSFLVYEFMEEGSLGNILSNKKEALDFEWRKRLNVVKGLADALSYMHYDCLPPVIHRDISSKNVLLDSRYHPDDLISSLSSSPPTVYGVLLKDILDMRLPSPGKHMKEEVVLVANVIFKSVIVKDHFRSHFLTVIKR